MSARLTPNAIAERELERCQRRRARLDDELIEVNAEIQRWSQVLDALNGGKPSEYNNAVEAE